MWRRVDGMRAFGFAKPGPFRDELTALVAAGTKTATTGLYRLDYEPEGEATDEVGERQVILDSDERPVLTIEVTRVESHPFALVPWDLARDEGEGFESIEHFRKGYRRYYGEQGVELSDDDLMICVWFRLVGKR